MTRKPLFFIVLAGLLFQAPALTAAPIVADHTVVEKYADIPQAYLDEVKKMWVSVPGESHSSGYRMGVTHLMNLDARFAATVRESGTPDAYTDQSLRVSRATWGDVSHATGWTYSYGEEDWYTSDQSVTQTLAHLTYCNTTGPALAAIGFGWCWDMTWHNSPGGTADPVYQVHWAGSSVGGPDGDLMWGLDDGDTALTGNRVNLDTYLNATLQYIQYCKDNSYPTKVFFTTGPVDGGGNTGENGYQRHLKCQKIRDTVAGISDGILFDYADILCWSNAGLQGATTWTDLGGTQRIYPFIHSDNMLDFDGTYAEDGDHIGQRGSLRLAKALWWMLARIAGWDGVSTATPGPTASFTPTGLMSATPTFTPTLTLTHTPTWTASVTPTASFTASFTPTVTNTMMASPTPTDSTTPTVTHTATVTPSPSITTTPTATPNDTPTKTATVTFTFSDTPSNTASPTASATPTETFLPGTYTPTPEDTHTSTPTLVPTATPTPTPTASLTASPTDSTTPSPTISPSASATRTSSPTPSPSSTPTLSPTVTHTVTVSMTPTASATSTSSVQATATVTNTMTVSATPTATRTATVTPSCTNTATLTATPPEPWTGNPVLYPNPVKEGNAVNLLPVEPMEVKVYTVASRRVAHWVLEDGRIPLIDTSGRPLANGLYYLVVQIGEKKFQLKLIVLR